MARTKTPLEVEQYYRAVVTVNGRDSLEGYTDDGRRVYFKIFNGTNHELTEADALRKLAAHLCEIADARESESETRRSSVCNHIGPCKHTEQV
jgi:hypothetical protein